MVADQLGEIFIGLYAATFLGIRVNSIIHVLLKTCNLLGTLPERWKNEPHPNKRIFPQFMDRVIEKGPLDTTTPIAYHIGLGALVTGLAVGFEVTLIGASTGVSILAYQTLGVAPDLVAIHQQIVAVTVLLTFAAMTYGTEKVQQDPIR